MRRVTPITHIIVLPRNAARAIIDFIGLFIREYVFRGTLSFSIFNRPYCPAAGRLLIAVLMVALFLGCGGSPSDLGGMEGGAQVTSEVCEGDLVGSTGCRDCHERFLQAMGHLAPRGWPCSRTPRGWPRKN